MNKTDKLLMKLMTTGFINTYNFSHFSFAQIYSNTNAMTSNIELSQSVSSYTDLSDINA
jgi:hypothetical protein